jgi:hypothetical protein
VGVRCESWVKTRYSRAAVHHVASDVTKPLELAVTRQSLLRERMGPLHPARAYRPCAATSEEAC